MEDEKKLKIYLNNCCFNRPFDDRRNIKNYLEREAILLIFQLAYENKIEIIGSEVLDKEISMIKDIIKHEKVQKLYSILHTDKIQLNKKIVDRASEIMKSSNTKSFDSLHLASAEQKANILLTTDNKFLRNCKRLNLNLVVQSPIEFVMEVSADENYY